MPTFEQGDLVKVPFPFLVRTAKIATIDARDATLLGKVGDGVRAQALAQIAVRLGWSA